MKTPEVSTLPAGFRRSAGREAQGTLSEVHYRVGNYINGSRQLVTNQAIDAGEAGRATVEGETILKTCHVYLPAGYDANDAETKYNVLYLLHGVGGDQFEWLRSNGEEDGRFVICNILDHLIASGEIEALILVFPNGRSAYDWTDTTFNSTGTNMLGFYYFDYELRYDLIPFVESAYHTYANIKDASPEGIEFNRRHRAIGGLSMGGMQALNLGLGGYRYDSGEVVGIPSDSKNGLVPAVLAPGMADLFAHIGAFSNAPTSSQGDILGAGLAASGYKLPLLYLTCGDADRVAATSYAHAIHGLADAAGEALGGFWQILIKDADHHFEVWNNGAYNFARLSFGKAEAGVHPAVVKMTLPYG